MRVRVWVWMRAAAALASWAGRVPLGGQESSRHSGPCLNLQCSHAPNVAVWLAKGVVRLRGATKTRGASGSGGSGKMPAHARTSFSDAAPLFARTAAWMRSCTLANASTSSTRISAALEAGNAEAVARPAAWGGGGGRMSPAAAAAGWPAQKKARAGFRQAQEWCGCEGNAELIRQNGLQVGPRQCGRVVSRRFPPLCENAASAATGRRWALPATPKTSPTASFHAGWATSCLARSCWRSEQRAPPPAPTITWAQKP